MVALKELYELTESIIKEFERSNENSREQLISDFNDYVSKRDQLIKNVNPPYNEEEKKLGQQLIVLDHQLQILVSDYFKVMQSDLAVIKKKRHSNRKYVNPYKQIFSKDGSFIDKKN